MKRRNERAAFEIITLEEYTLDWSQSKVFIVRTSKHWRDEVSVVHIAVC